MKNNHLQEDQEVVNEIHRSFLVNTLTTWIYLVIFTMMNGKFLNEQKFFMHLTEDQNFISKLLFSFSLIVLCTTFLSAAIYLAKRSFLRRYKHIKSNLFFLNNQWVVALNCLLKICGYAMLTLSFMSLQRLLVTTVFISLFSLLEERRDPESQLSPGFFSWRDAKLRSLFTYSLILAISFPVYEAVLATKFTQKLKDSVHDTISEVRKSLQTDTYKAIKETFSKIPLAPLLLSSRKVIANILNSKETKGGVFIIILLSFTKNIIDQSISLFRNFWQEVSSTTKRVEWFRLFSNFQSMAGNKKARGLTQGVNGFPTLCYESFILNPNFIRQDYTENPESFDKKFVKKIESVGELIRLVDSKVNNAKEKGFILYWVFNHINSFQEFFLYSESINRLSNIYSKSTTT